jgi:hypothetical protein
MNLHEQLNRIKSMMGVINEDENSLSKLAKRIQKIIESEGIINFLLSSHMDINDLANTFRTPLLDFIKKLFVGEEMSSGIIPKEDPESADIICDFIIDDIEEIGKSNTIIFNITIVGGEVTFDADGWMDVPGTYNLFDPEVRHNEFIWTYVKTNIHTTLEWSFKTMINKDTNEKRNVQVKLKIKPKK